MYNAGPNFFWRFLIRGSLYAGLTVVISGRFQLRKLELLVYIYIFFIIYEKQYAQTSYLTDAFVFQLNLSIFVFPYHILNTFYIKMPRLLNCRRFFNKVADSMPSLCWKARKHKYLNNTKSEFYFFFFEVLVQLKKKLQRLKQPHNCGN